MKCSPTAPSPPPSLPAQAESLQGQVDSLTADCAAQRDARAQAEQRLAALEAELAGASSALEQAKHTGTPKGARLGRRPRGA